MQMHEPSRPTLSTSIALFKYFFNLFSKFICFDSAFFPSPTSAQPVVRPECDVVISFTFTSFSSFCCLFVCCYRFCLRIFNLVDTCCLLQRRDCVPRSSAWAVLVMTKYWIFLSWQLDTPQRLR